MQASNKAGEAGEAGGAEPSQAKARPAGGRPRRLARPARPPSSTENSAAARGAIALGPLGGEPDAGFLPGRLRWALLLAGLLHGALLLWAALMPPPPPPRKAQVIAMDIVRRPPKEIEPKAKEPPLPPPKPAEPQPPQRTASLPPRALPRELQPVPRTTEPDKKTDVQSPAIVVPAQEPSPTRGPEPGAPKGPLVLFPKGFSGITGAAGGTAPVPAAPNRLLKDERLEAKKEPEFHLEPERGGGFKYDGKNFIGHISPEGVLTFEERFPIGVQRGGTFTFDLTDLVMKGGKQDPNAAEKRRFREFTEPLRRELRNKRAQGQREDALVQLNGELDEIWSSTRPAAVRRRELFEKWSEYADDREAAGGSKARRLIEEYIRKHLPAGSPGAYTDEELRRFTQQRQGQLAFNPYRGGASASASTPPASSD